MFDENGKKIMTLSDWVAHNDVSEYPGMVFINKPDSTFAYMNKVGCSYLGYENVNQAIGSKYHEMPCNARKYSADFVSQDKKVCSINETVKLLSYYEFSKGWTLALGSKSPIYNLNGDLIGIKSCWQDITELPLIDLSMYLVKRNRKMTKGFTVFLSDKFDTDLSERELECLYFILRGKTSKLIGQALGLSNRTVESYIDNIKYKWGCDSKIEIIDKAIFEGYMQYLPPRIKSILMEG